MGCCQHGEVLQCKRRRIYLNAVFFSYVQNEMLCIKHIIVFSPGNSFPVVARVPYFTRQDHRKTVSSGEDNNRIIVLFEFLMTSIDNLTITNCE